MTDEFNTIIEWNNTCKVYDVFDAATDKYLFDAPTLQKAWDEVKDECERRGVTMGDCDYRTRGPDTWKDVAR